MLSQQPLGAYIIFVMLIYSLLLLSNVLEIGVDVFLVLRKYFACVRVARLTDVTTEVDDRVKMVPHLVGGIGIGTTWLGYIFFNGI